VDDFLHWNILIDVLDWRHLCHFGVKNGGHADREDILLSFGQDLLAFLAQGLKEPLNLVCREKG
jgi:hypothetical protein